MSELKWLDQYSGQTVDELLSLEGQYRIDSLVVVLEQALGQKAEREGDVALSDEDRVVLAVEALEREVNSGGYRQFFENSSNEYAPLIVDSLQRIGCVRAADITRKAITALQLKEINVPSIEVALAREDEARDATLDECDESYIQSAGDLAGPLFSFVKQNKATIRL